MGDHEAAALSDKLASCDPGSLEHIDLLNELASLRLSQGQVEEAQQLYRQVLVLREGEIEAEEKKTKGLQQLEGSRRQPAAGEPAPADDDKGDASPTSGSSSSSSSSSSKCSDSDDDWEREWDSGLSNLKPAAAAAAASVSAAAKGRSSPAGAKGSCSGGSSSKAVAGDNEYDGQELPGPSGGGGGAAGGRAKAPLAFGDTSHVVEAYGLGPSLRESHLLACIAGCLGPDPNCVPRVSWLDGSTALLAFRSTAAAKALLSDCDQTLFRCRPFSEAATRDGGRGGSSSQVRPDDLLPPRERPKTTTTVAKRLLSHHLQMPELRDAAGERQLAQVRRDARQQRQVKREQMEAAWGAGDD